MTREELLRSNEYWTGEIQFNLFKLIKEYMEQNNLSRTELAEKLGVTKGYVSQILNGEFDHRISKLVELSMVIGKVPRVEFDDIEQILVVDLYNSYDKPMSEIPNISVRIDSESKITMQIESSSKGSYYKSNTISENNHVFEFNTENKYEKEKIPA